MEASIDRHTALLDVYAPRFRYHPSERFRATRVEALTDAAGGPGRRTELRRADGTPIASTDAASGLPRLGLEVLAAGEGSYAGIPGGDVRGDDYLSGRLPEGASFSDRPLAYGRVRPATDGHVWLQYWLFYYDNPHYLVGDHQGDWELVQLNVDPDRGPEEGGMLAATCFQHGEPEGRHGSELAPLLGEDGRLTVAVALGSHASYFDEENLYLGDRIQPTAEAERCQTIPIDELAGWVRWPGFWGGSRVMGHPRSPRGPSACRPEWEHPEDQHAAGLYARARRLGKPSQPVAVTTSVRPARDEAVLVAQAPADAPIEEFESGVDGFDLWSAVAPLHNVPVPDGGANQVVINVVLPEGDNAFDLAREISAGTGWEVEPDLDSTVFRPSPDAYGVCEEIGKETNDPRWAIEQIGCKVAWQHSRGAGVRVGHPDTGYVDHPQLAGGAILGGGYDVLAGDRDPRDVLEGLPPVQFPGHGTGTASVIASSASGPADFAGSAPEATVLPLRVARSVVLLRGSRLLRAIRLARAADCRVISVSLGGIFLGSALRRELEAAVEEGRIVLAAAGQPLPFVVEPASYESTLAVAGSTIAGTAWNWSARGQSVDFCAPAAGVPRAAAKSGGIAPGHGTSFAAALAAGVAAIWFAKHRPELLAGDRSAIQATFLSLVQKSSTPLAPSGSGDTANFGAGVIDAGQLMELPLSEAEPVEQPPPAPRGKRIVTWLSRLLETPVEDWLNATLPGGAEQAAERYGTELASLASEDEAVRLAMREAAQGAQSGGAPAGAAPAPLQERASSSLGAAMTQPA